MTTTLRRFLTPLGLLAAAIVFYIEFPFAAFGLGAIEPSPQAAALLAALFWVLAIVVVIGLVLDQRAHAETAGDGPAFVRYLFRNPTAGLFWLPIRLFVGFSWLEAGLHKAQGTGWLDGGSALAGFWKGAAAIPATGSPKITFDWYRDFLNGLMSIHAETWFSYLIVFGEIAVGVGLIVGGLVGIASFFGATMNLSFMFAGSASTNPMLLVLAIALLLARRVAGTYGIDPYIARLIKSHPFSGFTTHRPAPHVGTPMAA